MCACRYACVFGVCTYVMAQYYMYSGYFSPGMLTNITLHGVKALRDIVNDSVLDIFFYTSPKYRPEVWVWA